MTPYQVQIKFKELQEFLLEERLSEYLKVGKVEDLEEGSALKEKYIELMNESIETESDDKEVKEVYMVTNSFSSLLKNAKTQEERERLIKEKFKGAVVYNG